MNLKTLGERFAKLKRNERRLIVIACVAGVLLAGYGGFIEPALADAAAQERLLTQRQGELATQLSQLASLRAQAADPDARLRQDVDNREKRASDLDGELRTFSAETVPPEKMRELLQSLLSKHHNLTLTRLNTLPPKPLLTPPVNKPAARPAADGQPAAPAIGIYRHAIEITVSGGYADLTAYADELQRVTPRPLWSAMNLKVVDYPRSELTFTLYTLSLELPWLAV